MKAIVRRKYGSPDILELREIDVPVPKEAQVLVKVRAASVNPVDWHILRGQPYFLRLAGFGLFKPKRQVFGADLAGRVEAVGTHVTQFKVGDDVFGSSIGSFAEYACVSEKKLVRKPEAFSFEQAAAIPVAGLTALQGLRDHGKLQSGHHVLINGASGGVGSFAVQIAKAMGARVTGVCSGKNLDLVRSLGAHVVIDYTQEDYSRREEKFDLILDNAAFGSIRKPLRSLKPKGTYLLVGGSMASFLWMLVHQPLYSQKDGRKVLSMLARVTQADLTILADYLVSGKIRPMIERVYQFQEIPDAIRHVETGHTRGKVVITLPA